ncbi:hypothetical protein ACO2J1_07570 [Leptospira interrogans]|uniref:Uncharacterized protein n=1 Tax=Leptospira interrogans serovar Pomona TaxID=44276 RepID=A0AA40WBU3_LEPIR|nr:MULTISPECIES: hypothetical protein [Leptospira]MBE8344024.1 hypothetical protein [Leptospira interrogans serovar Pomona]MBE8353772.1 hypothetical protein [Leptospira interrogans serovar Pomona]MBE8356655.1 hypothetical protein [Leptospira interrogans serovar Pomona]MBE8386752.1 hypothetical protein [Leptospira interrogans serovar Pomona]MBE8419625.1 hypothetical protein [Leptospira interrogans serovar Pomona]
METQTSLLRSLGYVLSFPYFWVGDGGGKVRKIFLYQKNILFASKKTHSCRNT